MARQICRTCAKDFYHDKVGRPPVSCPECRGSENYDKAPEPDIQFYNQALSEAFIFTKIKLIMCFVHKETCTLS